MGKLPLKAVLANFLNHFETLESRRRSNSEDDLYLKEFQSMKELTESLKNDAHYSYSHGLKEVNRRKNRYKDILPYDYSRVILSEYPGVPGSDFINANYVRGSTGSSCAYIASQGPLPNTVVDFWRMIWETEVSVIVMACNETEAGKYKCECYWPENAEQEQQYGNITVRIVNWRQVCPDFLVRTMKITHSSDSVSRRVCQFHYTTWPDHGVPSTVQPILELVRLMRDCESRETRPILVHCSAGCGRTGTICSIDYVWALLRTGRLTEDFSLFNIIADMRRQRIAMVQTQEQYMLCYRAVAALFEQQLKLIDSHTYENLDEDGEPLMLNRFSIEDANTEFSADKESSSENMSDNESKCDQNRLQMSPTKDADNLMGVWQTNTCTVKEETNHVDEVDTKQEKLVGKATVIRRPSIAKLKAMFESREGFQSEHHEFPSFKSNNKVKLHRSFSTRERSSSSVSTECLSSQMKTSLSESKYLSVRSVYDRPQKSSRDIAFDIMNEQEKQDFHFTNGSAFAQSLLNPWSSQNSSASPQSEESVGNRDFHFDVGNSRLEDFNFRTRQDHIARIYREQCATNEMVNDNAPPKPPRTFQYNNGNCISNEFSSFQNNIPRSKSGRIIVSVALPKNQQCQQEKLYDYLTNNQPTISHLEYSREPNLYDFPSQTTTNSSKSKLYEHNIQSAPTVCKQMSRSSQGLVSQETFYNPVINSNNSAFTNFPVENFGALKLRRDMSVPALPIVRNIPTNNYVPNPKLGNGDIVRHIRHPPKYIHCDQSRNAAFLAQHPLGRQNYRFPVTYIRPQTNTNNKPVPANSNGSRVEAKPTNEVKNTKKKVIRTKNNGNVISAIPADNESHAKKQGHSFASLFSFGKKKKEKSKPNVDVVPTQQNGANVLNTVNVRPPHSHRFLPPTQWTQV